MYKKYPRQDIGFPRVAQECHMTGYHSSRGKIRGDVDTHRGRRRPRSELRSIVPRVSDALMYSSRMLVWSSDHRLPTPDAGKASGVATVYLIGVISRPLLYLSAPPVKSDVFPVNIRPCEE